MPSSSSNYWVDNHTASERFDAFGEKLVNGGFVEFVRQRPQQQQQQVMRVIGCGMSDEQWQARQKQQQGQDIQL